MTPQAEAELHISEAEDKRQTLDRKITAAERNRTGGLVGLVLGLLGFLVGNAICIGLGVLIAIAGGLTLITAFIQLNSLTTERTENESGLSFWRRRLAEAKSGDLPARDTSNVFRG